MDKTKARENFDRLKEEHAKVNVELSSNVRYDKSKCFRLSR